MRPVLVGTGTEVPVVPLHVGTYMATGEVPTGYVGTCILVVYLDLFVAAY